MTTAASALVGSVAVSPGTSTMNATRADAATTPTSCVRAPACTATGVRDDDAARDGEAAEQSRRGVGQAERAHLPVAVDALAAHTGQRPGEHTGVGEGDERDPRSRGDQGQHVIGPHAGERGCRQPLRQGADHGHLVGEPQRRRGDGGSDHRDRDARDG